MRCKKRICLILCVLILLVFSACAKADTPQAQPKESSISSENATALNSENEPISSTGGERTENTEEAFSNTDTTKMSEKKPARTGQKKAEREQTQQTAKEKSTQKETTGKAEKTTVKSTKKKKDTTNKSTSDKETCFCTFSIDCTSILHNMDKLDSDKINEIPANGIILSSRSVSFSQGESVYDVLQRICRQNKIQMEVSWTGAYSSVYIEGIQNIYELDCGPTSGWTYTVNGQSPAYGCSRYLLKDGDIVQFIYICN